MPIRLTPAAPAAVGLYALESQVDPYPITYSLQTHNLEPINLKNRFQSLPFKCATCSATQRDAQAREGALQSEPGEAGQAEHWWGTARWNQVDP
jgi:hypothetical protein